MLQPRDPQRESGPPALLVVVTLSSGSLHGTQPECSLTGWEPTDNHVPRELPKAWLLAILLFNDVTVKLLPLQTQTLETYHLLDK